MGPPRRRRSLTSIFKPLAPRAYVVAPMPQKTAMMSRLSQVRVHLKASGLALALLINFNVPVLGRRAAPGRSRDVVASRRNGSSCRCQPGRGFHHPNRSFSWE